jgi:hypothetical protein
MAARTEFDWVKSVLPSSPGRVGIDVARLSVTSGDRIAEELKPLFESIDVLCFDPKAGSVEQMIGLALRAGFRAEVLLDVTVTDRWRFVLLGLRRAP